MTCLMAYHNKKRTEAISIMLQANSEYIIEIEIEYPFPIHCVGTFRRRAQLLSLEIQMSFMDYK
jgi:hypothetical protein